MPVLLEFKNAGRRPAVQEACAPSKQCTHSIIEVVASSGTALLRRVFATCRAPTAENATTKMRRASVKQKSKAPARRRRYEGRRLQINYAAVVAVGLAAAAFYLFGADVALNQVFRRHLRGA